MNSELQNKFLSLDESARNTTFEILTEIFETASGTLENFINWAHSNLEPEDDDEGTDYPDTFVDMFPDEDDEKSEVDEPMQTILRYCKEAAEDIREGNAPFYVSALNELLVLIGNYEKREDNEVLIDAAIEELVSFGGDMAAAARLCEKLIKILS